MEQGKSISFPEREKKTGTDVTAGGNRARNEKKEFRACWRQRKSASGWVTNFRQPEVKKRTLGSSFQNPEVILQKTAEKEAGISIQRGRRNDAEL